MQGIHRDLHGHGFSGQILVVILFGEGYRAFAGFAGADGFDQSLKIGDDLPFAHSYLEILA